MTVFDYVFLAVLGLSAAIGMWRGLLSEVMAVAAWVFALLAAWRYNGMAAELFAGVIDEVVWRQFAGGAVVVLGVLVLAALLRHLLRQLLQATGLGPTDRFLGAVFGIARGLLVASIVVLLGGLAGVSREPWWTQALFSAPLESVVLASRPWLPEAVAEKIRFR